MVDGDGKAKDERVYVIEAVKTPAGEPGWSRRFGLRSRRARRSG